MKLSVVIPVYNEKNTILECLNKVEDVDLGAIEKEIIIIDDGSTDGTREILKTIESKYRVIYHEKNQGKGMAIRNGFGAAKGDVILIQDADLEYNPLNYPMLIKPILEDRADVVYGSRFLNKDFRHISLSFYLGNKFLTIFSNLLTGLNLTDMETCYKVFSKKALDEILPHLTAKRFEIEPELTARISQKRHRFLEVGLSFIGRSRTHKEGKKINWKDGLAAMRYMIKFNLFSR
ncbi:MAG: glycosyltransferase family 2 protein [Candidatus Nealsonbacteria bacterium]|nr:glycosyltransferase family 2 protein [Candidatus Nealsonbacteria bacterium]